MIRRPTTVALLLGLLLSACGGGGREAGPTAPPGGVVLQFEGASVAAEVVATDPDRQRGLMHRERLGTDAGMLFLFPTARNGGFWMKNTLIPLSIAYMSWEDERTFEVAAILDMEPCRRDPCRNYPPGVSYDAALEVNQGWFERHGIERGSVAQAKGPLPEPS